MSTIRNLVCNPSKINSTTLNMVNYNYQAALCQLQIVIKDELLIFNKPIQEGSEYTCLQHVPAKFYNIIFVVFHSNAIGLDWEFWAFGFTVLLANCPAKCSEIFLFFCQFVSRRTHEFFCQFVSCRTHERII
jgi:hypothetical protein